MSHYMHSKSTCLFCSNKVLEPKLLENRKSAWVACNLYSVSTQMEAILLDITVSSVVGKGAESSTPIKSTAICMLYANVCCLSMSQYKCLSVPRLYPRLITPDIQGLCKQVDRNKSNLYFCKFIMNKVGNLISGQALRISAVLFWL